MSNKNKIEMKLKPTKKRKEKAKVKVNNEAISAALTKLKMSQTELGKKCGCSKHHISAIVNGKVECISLPIALKVSIALGKKVEQLFFLK